MSQVLQCNVWMHQAIAWTYADLLSNFRVFCGLTYHFFLGGRI